MRSPEEIAEKIINDSLALPEEEMRREMLALSFKDMEPEFVAMVLEIIVKTGRTHKGALGIKAALVAPESMLTVLGEKKLGDTRIAAMELRLNRAGRLFTDLPARKVAAVSGYENEETVKTESLPLGVRRSLAKKNVKDVIDRLLSDPDPVVVANILNNPRITEKDALKIASKRPNSSHVLKLLATHKKWGRRYDVQKAVAQNPYSPPRIVIVLLEFLMEQDLKDISGDRTLHPQVKMVAREILRGEGD